MLQQEFFERTGVNLTGDEYRKVEFMYNAVKMDKDKFCKMWLELKDNQLLQELSEGIEAYELDAQKKREVCSNLSAEIETIKAEYKTERENDALMYRNGIENFANKLIKAGEYDMPSDIYNVIEEEVGIDYIIKSKHEQNIELTDSEISYMVSKL